MATKIIKPGKTPDAFRFKCPHCGCIFETCPNCHRLCCTDGDHHAADDE